MPSVPTGAEPGDRARFVSGGATNRARSSEDAASFAVDAALAGIARTQLGLVTVRQASDVGVDRSAIHRRRRAGLWVPVVSGVLRSTSFPPTIEQEILAGALAIPGSTVVGLSAAAIERMPVGPPGRPMVAVLPGRSARVDGVRALRLSQTVPSRRWYSVRRSTTEATIVLLPRFVDDATLERCLDHCLAHRLTTVDRVRRLLDRLPAQAVSGRRILLGLLDRRSEGVGHRSGLEQRVARWLDTAGLGGWQMNRRVPVRGGTLECDFVWPDRRIVLEVSPFFTHGSRATQERDTERRRLLVSAGWRVVEAGDVDLGNERDFAACAAALRSLLT